LPLFLAHVSSDAGATASATAAVNTPRRFRFLCCCTLQLPFAGYKVWTEEDWLSLDPVEGEDDVNSDPAASASAAAAATLAATTEEMRV
jgi:hypothetical protein